MSQTTSLPASSVVAAFDFDGTLTRGDSFFPFLKFAVGSLRFYWGLLLLSPILLGYGLRLISNHRAKQAVLTHYLKGWTSEQLQQVAEKFAQLHIPQLLRQTAMQQLQWHQQQGHHLILVSASLEAYLRPWADSLQMQVIGTQLEVASNQVTGRIAGKNCYGPEKVRRLRALVGDLDAYHLYAYGDSKGDRELLAIAQFPHYRSFSAKSESLEQSPNWQNGVIWSVLGAVLLYMVIVLWSGAEEFVKAFERLPFWTIPVCLGIVFLGFCCRFLRWQLYLREMGYQVPWFPSGRIFFAGFALSVSPGRAGESIRSLLLKRRYQIPIAPTLAGLVCERLTDLLSVFLLISFGVSSVLNQRWALIMFALIQVTILSALQRPQWIKRVVLHPMRRWARIKSIVHRLEVLLDSTSQLLKPKILILSVLFGSLSWVFEGMALYVIFQYLGALQITPYAAVMILSTSDLVGALSMMPGGIGGAEVTILSLALLYGASQAIAVTAMFLIRFLTLWFGVCVGIIALLWEQRSK